MNLATLAIASPESSLYETLLAQVRKAEGAAGGVEFAEPSGVAGIDYCAACGAATTLLQKERCGGCR